MHKPAITTLLLLVALLVPACASAPTLTMTGTKDLVYEEVRSPELAKKNYSVGMVVPPFSSEMDRYGDLATSAEAAMLKSGMRAVSSAHAAGFRAATKEIDSAEGAQLLEKAMATLKGSGAEFVVVLSHMEWSDDERPTRLFIGDGSSPFREVEAVEYGPWTGAKCAFTSPVLSFSGKIIDVASTETLATFETKAPANWQLPTDYVATMAQDGDNWVIRSASLDYGAKQWLPAAKSATENLVIQHAISLALPQAPKDSTPDTEEATADPAKTPDPAAKTPDPEASNPK